MIYIYASLLLHKAGKEVTESNVRKVLESAGIKVDDGRVKSLIAALSGVDIEKAIEESAIIVAPTAPVSGGEVAKDEKVAEKKDDKEAAAGLNVLFA